MRKIVKFVYARPEWDMFRPLRSIEEPFSDTMPMKSLLSHLVFGIALMLSAVAGAVSCASRGEEAPRLEVLSSEGMSLDGRSLNFGGEGCSEEIFIRSNGEWCISVDAAWLEVVPARGDGDGGSVVTAEKTEESRSAVVEVSMTAAPQVRVTFDVVQRVDEEPEEGPGEDSESEIIYMDSFDGEEAHAEYGASGDEWPTVAEFPAFAAFGGRGAERVTYSAEGVTVRSDAPSSASDSAGASGYNNLFFGGYSMFEISGILLLPTDSDLRLSFRRRAESAYVAGEGMEPCPAIWISGDGARWSRVRYECDATVGEWREIACDFSLVGIPESLHVAFAGGSDFIFRMDDVMLCTGEGGVPIDLDEGGEIEREEPPVEPAEREVRVSDIVAIMPAADGRVTADGDCDLLFDAVVQSDFAGGNCADATLVLAEEGAVAAGCGICLRGSGVEEVSAALAVGDRVRVRLARGAAMLCNDGGTLYVTGGDGVEWFGLESAGSQAEVTAVQADAAHLGDFQNMTVAVSGVDVPHGGVWCDDMNGEHLFTAVGDALHVFVRGGAAAFAGKSFGAANGVLRGIVSVRDGVAWLCPRNADDVADFDVVAPLPPAAVTVPELIAMMDDSGKPVVIDAERDRVLTAVVMNDIVNGNCNASHLILATESVTEAGNGITLYGSCVKPAALGVKRGDRVEVTLRAGVAVALDYNGMYEVTGDGSAVWAEVEIVASGCDIPVVDVEASQLAGYQGMVVRVLDAVPERGGLWYDPVAGGDMLFTTGDGVVKVRVLEGAAFAAERFAAVKGDITGLAVVSGGEAFLMPRDGDDVAAYADTQPDGDDEDPVIPPPGNPDGPDDDPGGSDDPSETPDDNPDDPVTPPSENPEEPGADPPSTEIPDAAGGCVMVTSMSELRAGQYYIGGYSKGKLYLATGGLTSVNHCNTAEFLFDGKALTVLEEPPCVVTLESAGTADGYYIRLGDEGYLSATGSGAGKLRVTGSRAEYWVFSENMSGGFDLLLSGDKFVRLVVSKTADEAVLRSIAADEEGNAIVLIRIGGQDGYR